MGSVPPCGFDAAVDGIGAGLDALLAEGWVPAGCEEAMARVRALEGIGRRVHAVQLDLQDRIDRSGVYQADGHASAKVMVRHGANLSNGEARRRDQVVKMMRALPAVAVGHAAGRIGTAQVERIARTFANRRVRDRLVDAGGQMARAAAVLPYREFDAALTDWERLVDEDGAGDRAERTHARRDFRMPRNFDGSNRFEGGGGSVDGAVIEDIWQRQIQREWDADWAAVRARLGDAATPADMARTDAQRRYDAMKTCFVRGDLAEFGAAARTCTDLVVDEVTFERHLAKLFGTDPGADPRLTTYWDDLLHTTTGPVDDSEPEPECGCARDLEAEPGSEPDAAPESDQERDCAHPEAHPPADEAEPAPGEAGGLVGFRCSSIDGRPLDPTEVVVATLIGHIRRVVTGADGVVLDMGRKARCFTGARQLAVRLSHHSCTWTGCDVPPSQCQCDHLEPFNGPRQGRTDPGNGGPACGKHNRYKENGFTISRDQRGRWHVHRPDGTEIT